MRSHMKRWMALAALVAPMVCVAADSAEDAGKAIRSLPWQRGPASGTISGKGTLKLPQGTGLLDQKSSGKFLEYTGNLPSDEHNILMGDGWWAAFDFHPVGYVKDDEKIDADAILKSMKDSDAPANEERRKHGLEELTTDGWAVPPHYDPQTRSLEWGVRLKVAGQKEPAVNYTVRMLGRTGYEAATLVSSPDSLQQDIVAFKTALKGFDFNAGEKYSEFKQGDRIAEFGLAALVAGGAAAVAVKTGFWKVLIGGLAAFWKFIAAGVVALLAFFGKMFKREPKP